MKSGRSLEAPCGKQGVPERSRRSGGETGRDKESRKPAAAQWTAPPATAAASLTLMNWTASRTPALTAEA